MRRHVKNAMFGFAPSSGRQGAGADEQPEIEFEAIYGETADFDSQARWPRELKGSTASWNRVP